MGRKIKRGKRAREEEMRKEQDRIRRALSMKLHHWWLLEALWAALCFLVVEHQLIYITLYPDFHINSVYVLTVFISLYVAKGHFLTSFITHILYSMSSGT
jgi:hypothetical protein